MGWFGNYYKDELIAKAKESSIKVSVVGNNIWTLNKLNDDTTIIGLMMLSSDGKKSGTYSYKPMDESMHPYQYDCPISFLKLSNFAEKENNQHAKNWREKVKEYHKKKSRANNFVRDAISGKIDITMLPPVFLKGVPFKITGLYKKPWGGKRTWFMIENGSVVYRYSISEYFHKLWTAK